MKKLKYIANVLEAEAQKVVYILRNHNGVVLAKNTDIRKIADEMLKYEAQTGNKTTIEISEGGPLKGFQYGAK